MEITFQDAVAKSKTLSKKPSNDILLQLYSLFKQATEGDAPEKGEYNMFDFVAKAKHDAWLKNAGLSKDEASQKYIQLVERLLAADKNN
jgi:diazepam-binding inhibitor (GABA receptor modulating acyl-CoA-binding protein)